MSACITKVWLFTFQFGSVGPSTIEEVSIPGSRLSRIQEEKADSEAWLSAAARRVLQEVEEAKIQDDTLEAWQLRAEQVVSTSFEDL